MNDDDVETNTQKYLNDLFARVKLISEVKSTGLPVTMSSSCANFHIVNEYQKDVSLISIPPSFSPQFRLTIAIIQNRKICNNHNLLRHEASELNKNKFCVQFFCVCLKWWLLFPFVKRGKPREKWDNEEGNKNVKMKLKNFLAKKIGWRNY